jgi:aminopeptidase N
MTTLADDVLVDERAMLDYDPDPLLAHELAHQWFGNLVTPVYWSDTWLSEGFASYLSALFTEHHQGPEAFALRLLDFEDGYFAEASRYQRPLVWDRWEHPIDMFDAHSYQKGAWVLHMLRQRLGNETFRQVLDLYLKSNAFGPVATEDFIFALEAVTESSFDAFFDRWVYAAGHPVLASSYTYDPGEERLTLHLRQVQAGPLLPDVVDMDLVAEIHTLAGATRFEVHLDEREEVFHFPVQMAPRFVLLDPDNTLLLERRAEQPVKDWVAQLRYAPDPVSRIRAARALADFQDDPALLIGLRGALEGESSPSVRTALVVLLDSLPPSSAVERVLLSNFEHPEASVRAAVLRALGDFAGSAEATRLANAAAQQDRSYSVQATAVRTLARLGAPGTFEVVQSALVTPSHRDVIRQAAFDALALLKRPPQETLRYGLDYTVPEQSSNVRVAATGFLGTLAARNRHALDRLLELLDDPDVRVRAASIRALGKTGQARVRQALERRIAQEPQPQLARSLQSALQQLQAEKDRARLPQRRISPF